MITNYQLSDIIGKNYKNGPVRFMPNAFSILCSIGNRLKLIDLKRNLSHTSDFELAYNICNFAINNTGTHAFIADENACCHFVNLNNDIILHSFSTRSKVRALAFSPDSRFIAIATDGHIKIYAIGQLISQSFFPFLLVNHFKHSTENVNSLDWSFDGSLVVAGGENRIVKVFSAEKLAFLNVGVFTFGHSAPINNVWFIDEDYGLLCIDKCGKLSVWQSSLKANELIRRNKTSKQPEIPSNELKRLAFIRIKRENLCQNFDSSIQISASTINKGKKLLVTAYTNGAFCIFELDEFRLIQNFRAGEERITSIDINENGDWLAIGCGQDSEAKLMVWEWQSESYILRQQSHSQTITGAAYSPDGSLLAIGAEDGKVKLWKCNTSLCLVTFNEHESGVTDLCFTQSGKAVLSASMEGSIRAHDLKRYRNFRTLVAPKQTQLNLLCADTSGDIVMAASRDQFEIYIWALETSQLLETLTGHSSIITGLATFDNTLCSVSRDKTLKFWNILEGSCFETVQMLEECLDVKKSPTGSLLAVLCFDSCINLFDTRNSQQIGSIETKLDIDVGRGRLDKIKKTTLEKNKTFTCVAFSPNGQFLLAGGQSNTFCLYSVVDRIRVRTFKLSHNLSLDGTALDVDFRKVTEFGNLDLFDLSDSEEEERNPEKKIRLPGTKHTDLGERAIKPIVAVSKIAYSPTGQDFAIVSAEGVHIFTIARIRRFDPFQLELNITPDQVFRCLRSGECLKALTYALRLNENNLIKKVIESLPVEQLSTIIGELGFDYAERLLAWIAENQSGPTPTKHFHFYLLLIKELLYIYGVDFKRTLEQNKPTVTAIQQILSAQQSLLMNMCEQNVHSLEYILMARKMSKIEI